MEMSDDGPMYPMETEIHNLVDQVRTKLSGLNLKLKPKLDFDFLSKFIRAKKYDVDKAADAIHRYYAHLYRNMDRLKGIKPSDYKAAIESQTMVILQNKVEGSKVVYSRVKYWDRNQASLKKLLNVAVMLVEEVLSADAAVQANGGIAIIDLEGLGFSHVREFLPETRFTVQVGLDGVPARLTAIHIVNAPTVFWTLHKVLVQLLSEKLRNRLHIHNNLGSLHEHISRSKLPISLGGTLSEEDAIDSMVIKKLLKYDTCYDDIWNGDSKIQGSR